MNTTIIIEIIIGGGAIFSGMFALIRYMISANTKREKAILDHHEAQTATVMEFYEKKNGHMERIAKDFSEAHKEVGKAMIAFTAEIKVLAASRNK